MRLNESSQRWNWTPQKRNRRNRRRLRPFFPLFGLFLSPLFFFLLSFVHRFQKNVTQAVKLKTKKRPKKLTPSDKKHVGATYPALPPPPPAFTILKAGASN